MPFARPSRYTMCFTSLQLSGFDSFSATALSQSWSDPSKSKRKSSPQVAMNTTISAATGGLTVPRLLSLAAWFVGSNSEQFRCGLGFCCEAWTPESQNALKTLQPQAALPKVKSVWATFNRKFQKVSGAKARMVSTRPRSQTQTLQA